MTWKKTVDEYKTRRLMNKYGVHWFKFDEPSGQVIDSHGNVVGTVIGATRVSGWNDEGYALSFDGNDYVQFNQKVIPLGTKSIRFKIKSGQTTSGRILVDYNSSNSLGFFIYIVNSMLTIEMYNGNTNKIDFFVGDNKWHDVLITYDGIDLKLYVDEMSAPRKTTALIETSWTTSICRIGSGNGNMFFNGQIDNLEIYNQALKPEELKLQKSIIQTETSYLYIDSNNQWQTLDTDSPSFQDYLEYGMDYTSPTLDRVNGFSLVDQLPNNFKIKTFTDNPNAKVLLSTPVPAQIAYANGDISLFGVETIDEIKLNTIGDAKVAISFDKGESWVVYRNGTWVNVANAHDGMTTSEINSLTSEQLDIGRDGSDSVRFSYSLVDGVEIDRLELKVSMRGTEQILPSDAYDMNYDSVNKTIVFNLKRDMTVSCNYVDGQ